MDKQPLIQDPQPPISTSQLLLDVLDRYWDDYKYKRRLCREQFSSEAVRGLRIATRRLLALIRLFRILNLGSNLQRLRCALKDQLDGFGSLRDTQVVLAEISGTIQDLPSLLPFQVSLQKNEKRLLRTVKKNLDRIKPGDNVKRIVKGREIREAAAIETIPARMLQAVDQAFLITRERLSRVDPLRLDSIHSVRLGLKKFRYLVEMIHPTLVDFPQENLKSMKTYQGRMGRIQDIEIFLRTLVDFAPTVPDFDPGPVLRSYKRRQAEAISTFLKEMGTLNIYWRIAPDQPFPWENVP